MAGPTDDEDAEEFDDDPAPAAPTLMQRLFSPAASPTVDLPTNSRGVPTKWSVDRLDAKERLYGYLGGAVAIGFALLIYAVDTHRHLKPIKGQLSPETSLILGLVGGIGLVASTRIGRRALVGFIALFTFLSFSSNVFLGLPFLLLAVWLLFRSYKVQKEATAKARAGRETGRTAGPSARTARSPKAAVASGRAAATAKNASRKGPPALEGNKRFTPKKPAPRRPPEPKPSWRERRATRASGS